MTFRITVLLSGRQGRGSNMAALAQGCASGFIPNSVIASVVGTHSDSPALQRAKELGLETVICGGQSEIFNENLIGTLADTQPDLVCLAGFMRKLPLALVRRYAERILNVHPALLPSFGGKGMYGHHIHEAVLAHGCKVSGATVHFVDEEFDTGPIILQRCVPVEESDTPETLGSRVLAVEHALYPEAVKLIAEGKLRVEGRRVRIR